MTQTKEVIPGMPVHAGKTPPVRPMQSPELLVLLSTMSSTPAWLVKAKGENCIDKLLGDMAMPVLPV